MSRSLETTEISSSQSLALVVAAEDYLVNGLSRVLGDIGIQVKHLPGSKTTLAKEEVDYLYISESPDTAAWLSQGRNSDFVLEVIRHLGQIGGKVVFIRRFFNRGGGLNHIKSSAAELGADVRSAVIGEIYASDIVQNDTLSQMVVEAFQSHKISIKGDGLEELHLTHINDVLDGLIKLTLNPYMQGREVCLVNPESISALSLAYKIRGLLEEKIELNFLEEEPTPSPKIDWDVAYQLQQEIGWQADKNLQEGIREMIATIESAPFPSPPPPKTQDSSSPLQPQDLSIKTSPPPAPHQSSKVATKLKPLWDHVPKSPKKPREVEFVKVEEKKRLTLVDINKKINFPSWRLPSGPFKKFFAIASLFFFLYVLSLVAAGLILASSLNSVKNSLGNSNYSQLVNYTPRIKLSTSYLKTFSNILASTPLLDRSVKVSEFATLISQVERGVAVLESSEMVMSSVEDVVAHILNKKNTNITEAIETAKLELDSFYQELSLFGGSLSEDPPSILPAKARDDYRVLSQTLSSRRKEIGEVKGLMAALPEMIGLNSRKKYLVLLQNNMELRPTGGFIGSFGIISFENGQLADIRISDVYSADGQLKGHVEPPASLKKHLGEANWYLRDSNWDPDFPQTAKRVEWFLDKEIATQVDGVVAINLFTIKEMVKAVGPLNIPDYNEEINSENLFERAEYHSEINFFPGSTQKKEFLAALTDTLFLRAQNAQSSQMIDLGRAFLSSLHSKQTLLYFNNESVQRLFAQLNWTGEIKKESCPPLPGKNEPSCLNDYVYTVDANVGINKANYFVRKKADLLVTIGTDETVTNQLKQTYVNTAKSGAWPAGNYKSYQRIYLPKNIVFKSLKIDGNLVPQEDITFSSVADKTELAYLLEVPINSTVVVELEYSHLDSLAASGNIYSLYWQKQSGTPDEPLTVSISHPLFLTPEVVSPQADIQSGVINFTLENSSDRRFIVSF